MADDTPKPGRDFAQSLADAILKALQEQDPDQLDRDGLERDRSTPSADVLRKGTPTKE